MYLEFRSRFTALGIFLSLLLAGTACATVEWINVGAPKYGANGFDGKSDDHAFRKALGASETRKAAGDGKSVSVTLYIPKGRYKFDQTLTLPKWLNVVADGPTSVLLDFRGLKKDSVAIKWGGPVDGSFPGEPISVSGFTLLGPDDSVQQESGTVGILVGSAGDRSDAKLCLARLSNIQITHFHHGIRLGGLNYMNKFEHLYLRENNIGLDKPNVAGEKDNGENIHFEFCVFGNNLRHFIVNPSMGGGYGLRFANCSFDYAHSTPEAEIGSAGMVVFDACHWETGQAGTKDRALLLKIIYPMSNLMFINTEFKMAGQSYSGTPIQWHSGASSADMNLTFLNCNFDGFGKPAFYGAAPAHAATQPVAMAMASPRLTANEGKVAHLHKLLERPWTIRGGETRFNGTVKFDSLAPRGGGKSYYACIDEGGRLYKKSTPCN